MQRMSRLVASLAVLLVAGCAGKGEGSVVTPGEPIVADVEEGADPGAERSPEGTLAAAEEALAAGEPARAVGLFARFLAGEPEPAAARQATLGLARAHEALGDCAAAIRTYGSYLTRFPGEADTADILARQGACHAELEQWDLSAESYAAAAAKAGDRLPSFRVEVLARLGFAHFQRGDFAAAEPPLR
ncbi:MAG: tetratricopeptide repeat protein, partial [Nannocystaceae bacterium]